VLTEEEYGRKASNVPVMMYHWVYTESDVPKDLDGNWILDTTLDEQMAYLSENEFYYPGWKELRAWIDDEISLPAKCAILTFDDGTEAFLKNGVPVLEKYKIPATSFMICWEKNKGAEKIREYASPYIEFESHTYAMHDKANVEGHKGIMATMSRDEIKADLAKSAELVGSNDAMAYPYGDYTDDMLEAVREQGILCSFTVEYDRVRKGMDPAKLPRIRVLGDESFQIWKESIY
jgi:peptidoglycan/xylan/chitin deacetylase (PgdA/CDA1 family)